MEWEGGWSTLVNHSLCCLAGPWPTCFVPLVGNSCQGSPNTTVIGQVSNDTHYYSLYSECKDTFLIFCCTPHVVSNASHSCEIVWMSFGW
jgi:hypothetical protein